MEGNWASVVHWKRSARLAAIVDATFPNYKRRTIRLRPDTEVTLHNLNWDEGSRSEYKACIVDGNTARPYALFTTMRESMTVSIPPNVVVVQGGTFCGKQATLYLHVNTDDMERALALQEGQS
jgi:hypothetical protein